MNKPGVYYHLQLDIWNILPQVDRNGPVDFLLMGMLTMSCQTIHFHRSLLLFLNSHFVLLCTCFKDFVTTKI